MSSPSLPLSFHIFKATSPQDIELCMDVRVKVFVDEQGYAAEAERDEEDATCDHFLLVETSSGTSVPVGNVRYVPRTHKLGRLAVLPEYRKHKLGASLVQHVSDFAVAQAREKGDAEAKVTCHAQAYVVGFYEKLGYVAVGPRFLEEDTEHQKMVMTVQL